MTMELLENRSLLSNVTVSFPTPSSPLIITGDVFNNNFTITENADGTVTVAGASTSRDVPGVGVVPPSTVAGLSVPFTTDSAVASIIVNLPGINNFDFVTLNGPGKDTPVTVRNVSITASGANLNFNAANLNHSGDFVLSNTATPGAANAALAVNIENSSFATLSISQTGGSRSVVHLGNNTIQGNVTVSQGNGDDNSITVGGGNIFGSTTLVQGAGGPTTSVGNSDRISVSDSTVKSLLVEQFLNGQGNQIVIDSIGIASINPAGPHQGVTATQGDGAGNLVTIAGVTTVIPFNPRVPLPAGFGLSNIVVRQGGGSGGFASVTSSTIPGSVVITQNDVAGNASGDTAIVSDVTVGYSGGDPIIAGFAGNITITQGDALDTAVVSDSIAVGDVTITQGNGGGAGAAGDQAAITNVTAGTIDVAAEFAASAPVDHIADIKMDRMAAFLDYGGLTVRYMPHMPEMQDVSGKARYENGNLHFDIARGSAVNLKVTDGTIDLTGLDKPAPQMAAIRLPITGSAQDVMPGARIL